MKIKIKNIGPILSVEYDLSKNILLVFGKNNIGKSFSVNLVYCLIKSFIENRRLNVEDESIHRGITFDKEVRGDKKIQIIEKEILDACEKSDNEQLNINLYIEKLVKHVLSKTFIKDFQAMFSTVVSSQNNIKNQLSKGKGFIIIDLEQISISIEYNEEDYFSINDFHIKSIYKTKSDEKGFEVYRNGEWIFGCIFEHIGVALIEDVISRIIFQMNIFVNKIHFLPASRSGLYPAINSFGPIIAELTKNKYFTRNRKIELPTLSEITSSYYISLSTLSENINDENLNSIAVKLEKELLKGKVEFNIKEGKLYYTPENTNLKLELSETSSMVAEISPIVTYLRYILTNKFSREEIDIRKSSEIDDFIKPEKTNLLIIEEPESHLHPESQLILMEIFAELANMNVKLMITSHSNYMFNKLGNLILDNKIDYRSVESYHLEMTENGSVDIGDMIVSREGIEDYNFVDVSEKLYEERINLLERLEDDVTK